LLLIWPHANNNWQAGYSESGGCGFAKPDDAAPSGLAMHGIRLERPRDRVQTEKFPSARQWKWQWQRKPRFDRSVGKIQNLSGLRTRIQRSDRPPGGAAPRGILAIAAPRQAQ